MLHEILFALLGKTGNIIIESDQKFEINPLITFLTTCEKELINKLVIFCKHLFKTETNPQIILVVFIRDL